MSLYGTLALGGAILTLVVGYVYQRYSPAPPPKIAGIDLGTTFSSIGVYHFQSGKTEILANDEGKKTIPSVVAYLSDGRILVGQPAVAQSELNPTGTIYDAKRFIGKTFADNEAFRKEYRDRYPFHISIGPEGTAAFRVPDGKQGHKLVTPQQVGAEILRELRRTAEARLGWSIGKAVVSVPAEFDDTQRNATKAAAALAGLDVLRVVSEPTAAALAYGLHQKKGVEYVVVVDLGGGTLDVSLLWLQNGMFITTAMAGNNRLGIQNLRLGIETAKLKLTTGLSAKISTELPGLGHFEYTISREEFEKLNEDLFESIKEPILACLEDGNIPREDVDEVVLVGGSTRIPRVRSIVGEFFKKAPNYGVDPDLAVTTGAAVQAGVLLGGWPLKVSATELTSAQRKRHVYTKTN